MNSESAAVTTETADTMIAGAMRLRQRLIDMQNEAALLFHPLAEAQQEAIRNALEEKPESTPRTRLGEEILKASNAFDEAIDALVAVAEYLAKEDEQEATPAIAA